MSVSDSRLKSLNVIIVIIIMIVGKRAGLTNPNEACDGGVVKLAIAVHSRLLHQHVNKVLLPLITIANDVLGLSF